VVRPVGATLQSTQSLRVVAPLPAVKGFTADPEVATGQGRIPAVSYLSEHMKALEAKISDAALDRFEKAFIALNKVLGK